MLPVNELLLSLVLISAGQPHPQQDSTAKAVAQAVAQLLSDQQKDGAWPYEGVYRVKGEIPVGYRVGGTALVCQALLYSSAQHDDEADAALQRGLSFILSELDHPLMQPSRNNRYDVRIWGHACALEFLCHLRKQQSQHPKMNEISTVIDRLVGTILFEQLEDGGWNYASRNRHASFVTAFVVQSLLWARSQQQNIPEEVFERARDVLLASRVESGAFFYSGSGLDNRRVDSRAQPAGSSARSPLCNSTLFLLNASTREQIAESIAAFFEHWDELEKRRQKNGTHAGPYGIAPYYFYFGHRYAAQAIELTTADTRTELEQRFCEVLMRTRDEDGTWNDRVFERSRSYGTAMALLALSNQDALVPPAWTPRTKQPPQ